MLDRPEVTIGVGATGVSSPIWLHWVTAHISEIAQGVMLYGGASLVVIQVAHWCWRGWRNWKDPARIMSPEELDRLYVRRDEMRG